MSILNFFHKEKKVISENNAETNDTTRGKSIIGKPYIKAKSSKKFIISEYIDETPCCSTSSSSPINISSNKNIITGIKRMSSSDANVNPSKQSKVGLRKYNPAWAKELPWLEYNETTAKMHCNPCKLLYSDLSQLPERGQYQKYSKGTFVVGTNNFRHSNLVDHNNSEGHKIAVIHVANKKKPQNSQDSTAIRQLSLSANKKLEKIFQSAHAIAKKNRPFTDLAWMCELDRKKGIDVGESYQSDKHCQQFVNCIANVEVEKIKHDIGKSKFITLISDSSTDTSTQEIEAIYVRYAIKGIAKTKFLCMKALQKPDSSNIFKALKESVLELRNDETDEAMVKKVVGFTADGASVNTGEVNGVIAKMRNEWSPAIVIVTCMAHRLELAFKEAFKEEPLFDKVLLLLSQLHTFYRRSPLQKNGLRASFVVSIETIILMTYY
jgi:hypothetical protein